MSNNRRIWKNSAIILMDTPVKFVVFLNKYGYGDFLNYIDLELQVKYKYIKEHNLHCGEDIDVLGETFDFLDTVNNTLIKLVYDIMETYCPKYRYYPESITASELLSLASEYEIDLTSKEMEAEFLVVVHDMIHTFTNTLTLYGVFEYEKYIHELNEKYIIIEAHKE